MIGLWKICSNIFWMNTKRRKATHMMHSLYTLHTACKIIIMFSEKLTSAYKCEADKTSDNRHLVVMMCNAMTTNIFHIKLNEL